MLARRKQPKMGMRVEARVRSQGHLKFVRGFVCAVMGRAGHECEGKIEAHHVRHGTDGAMGQKPSDEFAVPLCGCAHRTLHDIGEVTFQSRYGVDLLATAAKLWRVSPHRKKEVAG